MNYTKNDLYEGMKLRCISTMERDWWNVGKQYEVEKSKDGLFILKDEKGYIWNRWLILDCLNGKHNPVSFEIVEEEKEEAPTLKANVTVDVKEVIQAKIDELRNEAEHLFKKRDRLEQHGINLNKKAQKLEEVIETIKEFE